ncbi:hypothetical protein L6252_03560 [Candidatus Parcubacteria bacterium]|nr:hypothetical protein [Candidatus Parcubacteria bacterium]
MSNQNNFLKEKLLSKIKKGEIKMKPKAFFALKIIATALALLACFFLIIYLLSFASFCSSANGLFLLKGFGFWGFQRFFFALPWLLILFCLLLLFIFEVIAKKFALVWKKPLIYSLLIIILFSLLLSFILSSANLHPRLFSRAQRGNLPLMGGFYRNLPCSNPKQIHFGKLIEKTENGFLLGTEAGEKIEITFNERTRFKFDQDVIIGEELAFIFEGDSIAVVGEKDDGQIEAFGIIKLPINFRVPPCGLINLRPKPLYKP